MVCLHVFLSFLQRGTTFHDSVLPSLEDKTLSNWDLLFKEPSHVAHSVGHLTRTSEVLGSIPSLATYFRFSFRYSRGAVVSYWQKYVHEVLVNRLGGLNLPRKSVVRLTDQPDMTLDVYGGRKTTTKQQQQL